MRQEPGDAGHTGRLGLAGRRRRQRRAQADTPTFDRLWSSCPHAFLRTSGRDVGLPQGQMGNSEVGHLNIGAGRLVMQDLPRINDAIADGRSPGMPALVGLIERLRQTGGTCHLMGLVSPGGVHSHQDHAVALAKILAEAGVPTVVHAFTDGRDTPPRSAADDLERLQAALPPSAADRHRLRPLLRDGSRQSLGPRRQGLRRRSCERTGPRFPDAGVGDRRRLCARHHRRVRGAGRGRRLSRHARWRRPAVLQFPRRPRARDPGRPARSGLSRLSAPAQGPLRRRRRHDAVQRPTSTRCCRRSFRRRRCRTCWARWWPRPAARSCAWPRRRSIRTSPTSSTAAARSPMPGEDAHHGALAEGRHLRPAAGDVGAGADRQGGRGDRARASTT